MKLCRSMARVKLLVLVSLCKWEINSVGSTCSFADEMRGGHCIGDTEEHFPLWRCL